MRKNPVAIDPHFPKLVERLKLDRLFLYESQSRSDFQSPTSISVPRNEFIKIQEHTRQRYPGGGLRNVHAVGPIIRAG
jgi:hypothetical protein